MHKCFRCQKVLISDEIGLYRRMVNRGAVSFLCIDCLASHFKVERTDLEEKLHMFKEAGCTLFS